MIVNGQRCGRRWIVVRNHVEVEISIIIISDNLTINQSSPTWANDRTINFLEEANSHFLVDQYNQELGGITLLVGLDSLNKVAVCAFEPETVILHCGASDSISVDNYLPRENTLVPQLEVLEGVQYESCKQISSIGAKPALLLILRLLDQFILNCLCAHSREIFSTLNIR